MGACISTTKVTTTTKVNAPLDDRHRRKDVDDGRKKLPRDGKDDRNDQDAGGNRRRRPGSGGGGGGAVPCGKKTDFGYDKDFDQRYSIGKLLGHGQFGYTYVATDKETGDRVAVKRIEKNK